jgi:hypothetical protein
MFGKKKEKQRTENMVSEVNERTAIEILVTEEDKTGSKVTCGHRPKVKKGVYHVPTRLRLSCISLDRA